MRDPVRRSFVLLFPVALFLAHAPRLWAAPAGPAPVARTAALELLFDPSNGDVAVRDLRCGEVWRSNPQAGSEDKSLSEALRQELGSPFLLSYRDVDMKVAYSANRFSPGVTFSTLPLDGGIRVTYRAACSAIAGATSGGKSYAGTLGFSIEYVLAGDALQVRVPVGSMVEEGDFIFISLQLLPFFGATPSVPGGALVLPDGTGSAVDFRPASPQAGASFSIPVYGEEKFSFPAKRRTIGSLQPDRFTAFLRAFEARPAPAYLPAFGILRHGRGIACVVSAGEMYARVRGALAGVVFDYNRIGVDFDYRTSYVTFYSRSKTDTKYLKAIISGDRAVRYVFLAGPDPGPGEIAAAARAFLAGRGGTSGTLDRVGPDAPGVDLRIFCAVGQPRLFGRSLVVATTFAQAVEIVRYAMAAGLRSPSLTLVGWEAGGYQGELPRKLPPDRRLGGERGLADLVKACHGMGVHVFLEVDYLLAVPGGKGFRIGRDGLMEPNRIARTDGEGSFLVSPRSALERYAPREMEWFARMGIDGLAFRHLGQVLLSDYGRGLSREQSLEAGRALLGLARSRGLRVRVDGGSAWTLGWAEALYDVPLSASGFPFADREEALYETAVHGLAGLISEPVNRSSDMTAAVLRCIGLGVTPSLELTAADPVALKDTAYNGLYRAKYREVIDDVSGLLAPAAALMPGLVGQAMAARSAPAPGISRTRYEGGTEVIVNTTGMDFPWQGKQVRARGYLILAAAGASR